MVEPISDERLAELKDRCEGLRAIGLPRGPIEAFSIFTAESLIARIEQAERERVGERRAREISELALRNKDAAMDVLFDRMDVAGVDYSDLLS